MAVKKPSANDWRLAVTYGLPLGVFWIALFLFSVWQNQYNLPIWLQIFNWLISLSLIGICIKQYRNGFENPSDMKFWSAVRIGFLQSLIAAAFYGLVSWFLAQFVYVDCIANILEAIYSQTLSTVGNESVADAQFDTLVKVFKPWMMGLAYFFNGIINGFIYSLLAALILRRKPREANPFQG